MSSKRDSAYCDSLQYSNNIYGNSHLRRVNSDCLPSHSPYQLCSDMDQLRMHSCEVLPRYVEPRRIEQNSACSNFGSNFERRPSSCEGTSVCRNSHHCHVPIDPGGGNFFIIKYYNLGYFLGSALIIFSHK